MIIQGEEHVTEAVLQEYARIGDDRLRALVQALVRHLHAFARETRLTEKEFQAAARLVAALGQQTTPSHNEVVLMAGSLGLSTLVCLMNNGQGGVETSANLLGPFWRENSPKIENGGSIIYSPVPGIPTFVTGRVEDQQGAPVAGAEVDIWHSSTEGLYENQDPSQKEMNLRGRFVTDGDGVFRFRSIKPAGYPIPTTGVVGQLLDAAGRHCYRPAHIHALIYKPGFKTITAQVYSSDDPHLDTDVQFGVTQKLIATYAYQDGPAPDADIEGQWCSLDYTFTLEPGEATMPKPPITAKVERSLEPAA